MLSDSEFSYVLNPWNSMGKSIASIEPKTHAPSTQQIGHHERGKDPYLVFKNVPSSINVEILINICSAFGKVLRGRQHEQFNMYFVNFATINDLLNVLEGLKDNLMGMTIELGKTVLNQTTNPNPAVENQLASERSQHRAVTFDIEQQRDSKDKSYNHILKDGKDLLPQSGLQDLKMIYFVVGLWTTYRVKINIQICKPSQNSDNWLNRMETELQTNDEFQ